MASGGKKMKKVEIVIEAIMLDQVISIIDQAGVSGYTILPSVTGRGHRGRRTGFGFTDVFNNAMVFTLTDEEAALRISQEVKKLIQNYAGMVIISDVNVVWPDYQKDGENR